MVEDSLVDDDKRIKKLLTSNKEIELSKKDVKPCYEFYIIDEGEHGQFYWGKKNP